jgi:hypothetical protein
MKVTAIRGGCNRDLEFCVAFKACGVCVTPTRVLFLIRVYSLFKSKLRYSHSFVSRIILTNSSVPIHQMLSS